MPDDFHRFRQNPAGDTRPVVESLTASLRLPVVLLGRRGPTCVQHTHGAETAGSMWEGQVHDDCHHLSSVATAVCGPFSVIGFQAGSAGYSMSAKRQRVLQQLVRPTALRTRSLGAAGETPVAVVVVGVVAACSQQWA